MAIGLSAAGYQVSVGTYVANAGRQVTVPVMVDDVSGLAYAGATLTYDPQVLVVTKASAGSLGGVMADDFTVADTNGTICVTIFADRNMESGSGSIADITFAIREGTEGRYSDIAVTEVSFGDKTGVKDVSYGKGVTTVNGMVRVMSTAAQVTRLENAETICADTVLGALALDAGDAIQASDGQTAICVNGVVTANGPIPVKAPVNGWASGTYALLSTMTPGLTFTLEGMSGEFSSATTNGMTTYSVSIAVLDEVPVVAADPSETLTAGSKNQIRANAQTVFAGKSDAASLALKALYESASKIEIAGPRGQVSLIADMGISPAFAAALDETGTLRLTYAMPTLAITSFDPSTGAVHIKVTPGNGNQIVSEIATGYIHVYGSSDLRSRMRNISSVGFDLTPYLRDETKGEGVLIVTLGSHTFLKVKIESAVKDEGDIE